MSEIIKPIYIVGISRITSNDPGQNEIAELWGMFSKMPIKEKLGNKVLSDSVFSVYSDYENGHKGKYKITIGYSVSDFDIIPEGLTTITIPAGDYKIYPCKSQAPEDIIAVWKTIWSTDVKLLNRNFVADFEVYSGNEVVIHIG